MFEQPLISATEPTLSATTESMDDCEPSPPQDAVVHHVLAQNLHAIGFSHEREAVAPPLLEALRASVTALCRRKAESEEDDPDVFFEGSTRKVKQIQYLHRESVDGELLFGTFHDAMRSKLARMMAVDVDAIAIVNMQLFVKHPTISKPTRHHQDNAYLRLRHGDKAITAWVPLDDVDQANGCLHYVPYSHKMPTMRHERYNAATTFRVRSGVPGLSLCLRNFRESDDLPVVAKAGDALYHLGTTVHRANANVTQHERRVIGVLAVVQSYAAKDPVLEAEADVRLKEDIALQQFRDIEMYHRLTTGAAGDGRD